MKKQLLLAIKNRFSPMIYSDKDITNEKMYLIFSAAQLTASCYNKQPWLFLWSKKGMNEFNILFSLLSEYNQLWANTAPILMLSIALNIDENGKENSYALFDLGQAVASMAIQASYMGIQLHQMAGFNHIKARQELSIPKEYLIGSMIAMGYPGNISELTDHLYERAIQKRTRKHVSEFAVSVDFFKNK